MLPQNQKSTMRKPRLLSNLPTERKGVEPTAEEVNAWKDDTKFYLPRKFAGGNNSLIKFLDHYEELKRYLDMAKTQDKYLLMAGLVYSFDGVARDRLRDVLPDTDRFYNDAEFKEAEDMLQYIYRAFTPHPMELMNQYAQYRQSPRQSFTDYLSRKYKLFQYAYPKANASLIELNFIEESIAGMHAVHNPIKRELIHSHTKTFDELMARTALEVYAQTL